MRQKLLTYQLPQTGLADCLGVRGIARDLAAAGSGKLRKKNFSKIKSFGKQNLKVKIKKEKNQGCSAFGSFLIKDVKNKDLWVELDKYVSKHNVKWHWVKGHAGHEKNEIADALANKGIDSL